MTFDELMDCYDMFGEQNRQVYQDLLGCAKRRNLIPFFGAGISYWAYPGWKATLTDLAKNRSCSCSAEVDALLKGNQYEAAASRIEAELGGKETFCRALSNVFSENVMDEKHAERPAYMNIFPEIFQGPVITTNFDRCIEKVFADNRKPIQDTVTPENPFQKEKTERMIHEQKPLLVKMHGDINNPDHLVFTKESYDETYGGTDIDFSKPLPRTLKLLLERSPVLFVGCGLNADRTCSVIRECAQNGRKGTHFAIMEMPEETWGSRDNGLNPEFQKRRDFLVTQQNLSVIWYPHGKHNEALTAFFRKLSQDIKVDPSVPVYPLGCVKIWVPERNEERNECKKRAIRESKNLYLMAETGHSFLTQNAQFRACVNQLLNNKGNIRILLKDATVERPFLSEEQKEYIAQKRNMALAGYEKLKKEHRGKVFLKTVEYHLPASILITDRYGFFEPYIQNEEERNSKSFDTFELMFDRNVSEAGYNTLLSYFEQLFDYGTEYKKTRRN